jgi:hypothetical protein
MNKDSTNWRRDRHLRLGAVASTCRMPELLDANRKAMRAQARARPNELARTTLET